MFESYIGRKCMAIVAFGSYTLDGGSCPLEVKGVLESSDDNYITISTKRGMSIIAVKALLVLHIID